MPCHRLRADLIQGRDGELSIHPGKLLSSGVSDKTMVIISRRGYRSLRGFRIGANGASVAPAPGRRGRWKRAERMSPPRPDPGARPSCSSRSVFNDRGAQEPVIIRTNSYCTSIGSIASDHGRYRLANSWYQNER